MTEGALEFFGWEILARALRRAKLDLIVGVAGKPVTPTQEALVESGDARWVNHEATAAQMALGASALGARTAILVKQVGLNAAIDVLACAGPHRSGGAMVVVSGDDPGSAFSQIEGDSRQLAAAVELPCFEPAGVADIPDALFAALEASARAQAPVVLRVTTPLLDARAVEPATDPPQLPPAKPFDPGHWSTDLVAHRRLLMQELHRLPEGDATWRRPGSDPLRVVASGLPAAEALASTDADLLVVRRAFPAAARALADFLGSGSGPVLVLEESSPYLEDQVRAHASEDEVLGRRSGHVAWAGPIDVAASIAAARTGEPLDLGPLAPSPGDPDADLSPFGTLWSDAADLGLTPIAVDAGHCWAGVFLDGDPAPLCYGLGSATGVASGIALARGGPAIAVTGDMGAFHAGLVALVQAVRDQVPVITFVEDDGAAQTTGAQPTPSAVAKNGERVISFEEVARAIGVEHVETVTKDQMTSEHLRPKLELLTRLKGPSVVVIDEKSTTAGR